MSRIAEAMRRAAGVPKVTEGMLAQGDGCRLPAVLDDYPREERRAASSPAPEDVVAGRTDLWSDDLIVPRFSDAYKGRLIVHPDVPRASIEQYRRLAASIHHLQGEHGLARLMVSSALPREGKTLTTVNLAMTLSESYGRRVLLIDADLRRPSIHEVFGFPNRHGLSDVLGGEPGRQRFPRVSRNLWVLPAGSAATDPMATLASSQFDRFLDEVNQHFDWVLLDSPPFGIMADAHLLARLTRAVVLVIAAGSTPYPLVQKTVNDLGREHIVGIVLNRVETAPARWSEYTNGHETGGVPGWSTGEAPDHGKKVEPLRS